MKVPFAKFAKLARTTTRRQDIILVAATLGAAALAGCATDAAPPEPTGEVSINVAPLTFTEVGSACYSIVVTQGTSTVFSEDWVCSGAALDDLGNPVPGYGNGPLGDIAYVGTCVDDNETGSTTNHVVITLHTLYDASGNEITDWVPPPAYATDFDCEENTDARIDVDFVVLRQANQGFLDVTVDFEDMHCSAKVDCVDDLLLSGGSRRDTIVVALTCDTGEGGFTSLFMDDIVLSCTTPTGATTTVTVDPTQSPGTFTPANPAFVTGALGTEGLSNGGSSSYWTVAIGMGDLSAYSACAVTGLSMSAGDGTALSGYEAYPVIGLSAPGALPFWNGSTFACTAPLDGAGILDTSYASGATLGFDGCLSAESDPSTPASVQTLDCP